MADQPDEKVRLADGTVSLYRNAKFVRGAQELEGDRMVVEHETGDQENVVVIQEGGKPKVKRLVQQLVFQTFSPATRATSTISHSFADLDADSEKRLLAIYKMFPSGNQPRL